MDITIKTLITFGFIMTSLSCRAATLTGRITCDGIGVAGVAVSDGHDVVYSDEHGDYSIIGDKSTGCVFYSLPSGYEPDVTDGFNPRFWAALSRNDDDEQHDFVLHRATDDGTRHAMIIAADTHLARRNNDLNRFTYGFVPRLKREVRSLHESYETVHSTILGDLTWDNFWRSNEFDLHDFMDFMAQCHYPCTLWAVIGNHDNDPSVPAGATTDDDAAAPWRDIVCPTYYSYNIGQVHYVVLDDIFYLNEALEGEQYTSDVAGSRNFVACLTERQYQWLENDLSAIDTGRPIVVSVHIPVWRLDERLSVRARLSDASRLCNMLSRFKQVHIVSGHTHINAVMHPGDYPNITEHNIAAVCASWWWTGRYTGHDVCIDGSPAGYELLTVNGDEMHWRYHSIERDVDDAQFRIYDMNTVREFYRNNATMRAIMERYPDRMDYSNQADNRVMVNVFGYDSRTWRVNIYEGDTRLWWTRETVEDPLHTLCYEVPRFADVGYYTEMFATSRNNHTFVAEASTATAPITVRVTDGEGNTYIKCINRPLDYSVNMDALQPPLAPGDVNRDGNVNVGDVNVLLNTIINPQAQRPPLPLCDINDDGVINVADVNMILNFMLRPVPTGL